MPPPWPALTNAARPARACLVFFRPAAADPDPDGGEGSKPVTAGGESTSDSWSGAEAGIGCLRLSGGELGFEPFELASVEDEDEDDEAGSESRSMVSTSWDGPTPVGVV